MMWGCVCMKKEKIKDLLILSIALFVFMAWLHLFHITCPIKWFTGISCPGCGMTRAWLQVLQGHFYRAFYFHPLWWIVPIVFIFFLYKDRLNKKIYNIVLYILLLLFIVVYFYRFTLSQDIVVCKPQNAFLYQLWVQYFID